MHEKPKDVVVVREASNLTCISHIGLDGHEALRTG